MQGQTLRAGLLHRQPLECRLRQFRKEQIASSNVLADIRRRLFRRIAGVLTAEAAPRRTDSDAEGC